MAANELTEQSSERNLQAREDTRSSEKFFKPAVNIVETAEGLMLIADIPGASKDTLEVSVEKGILTISSTATHNMPGQSVYTEFELASYYRQFSVPETIDHQKAMADLSNGILMLKIPKTEAAKPRKIEVKVG
jgi:HSP20 family protein